MSLRSLYQVLVNGREMSDVDPNSILSNAAPKVERTGAASGAAPMASRDDHQHDRLTSATIGSVVSGNTAVVNFTRLFANEPTIDYSELPPSATTTTPVPADTDANAQPTTHKVIAWKMDTTDPTKYAGCTIRVFKSQVVPQNLVSLLLGAVYNLFGASVVGTRFSIIALARSDV